MIITKPDSRIFIFARNSLWCRFQIQELDYYVCHWIIFSALEADAAMRYRNLRLTLTLTSSCCGFFAYVLHQMPFCLYDCVHGCAYCRTTRYIGPTYVQSQRLFEQKNFPLSHAEQAAPFLNGFCPCQFPLNNIIAHHNLKESVQCKHPPG